MQPVMSDEQARQIMKVILALQNTAVDPNDNLQALWPFSEVAMTYRIEPTSSKVAESYRRHARRG